MRRQMWPHQTSGELCTLILKQHQVASRRGHQLWTDLTHRDTQVSLSGSAGS